MADSRSKRRGEDLPLPPRPPRRPPPQQPRGQTEEEIMRDRSGLDSRFRNPMMTNEDPGYIMGGPQMTDPYNFEYMRRQKEKRESEGIRLKKGGPAKKYEGGGMVEIEIKVGGGGKRKGKHKMPDGSMMDDDEMESEDYRKGGRIRKYAQGGEVDDSDRPEERGPVGLPYNQYLKALRSAKQREEENKPASLRSVQALLNLKKTLRGPSAGGSERLAREAAEDETARRGRVASAQRSQRVFENALEREGARIGQRRDLTRVEDNGYKKGGMVKPKAPVKKAMGGKVAAKPMGKPVMKKAGGRVAAKPMMKGRKK